MATGGCSPGKGPSKALTTASPNWSAAREMLSVVLFVRSWMPCHIGWQGISTRVARAIEAHGELKS